MTQDELNKLIDTPVHTIESAAGSAMRTLEADRTRLTTATVADIHDVRTYLTTHIWISSAITTFAGFVGGACVGHFLWH